MARYRAQSNEYHFKCNTCDVTFRLSEAVLRETLEFHPDETVEIMDAPCCDTKFELMHNYGDTGVTAMASGPINTISWVRGLHG